MKIAFSCMTMPEVEFFSELATVLSRDGHRVTFINFFEPGDDYLTARNHEVFSLQKARRNADRTGDPPADLALIEKRYGFSARAVVFHEVLTRGKVDDAPYLVKLMQFLGLIEAHLDSLAPDLVIQELGGFIAPMALYQVCRRRRIDHFFIEPAPFPERFFLNHNQKIVRTLRAGPDRDGTRAAAVDEYLSVYHGDKLVAISDKDRHRYRDATLFKFVNPYNLKRLLLKLSNIYIRKHKIEYDSFVSYCIRHINMYKNRKLNAGFYTRASSIDFTRSYYYFPFHVPLDFALTVRAERFLDQMTLVERIARELPADSMLYVKEHPAGIGIYGRPRVRALLGNSNVRLLHPSISSYDIIRHAKGVITINSKVGFEALLHGKPVYCLGESFYRGAGVTQDVDDVAGLAELLRQNHGKSETGATAPLSPDIERFVHDVFATSLAGELFRMTPDNISAFAASLSVAVSRLAATSMAASGADGS